MINSRECGRLYRTYFKYSQHICRRCMNKRAVKRNITAASKKFQEPLKNTTWA